MIEKPLHIDPYVFDPNRLPNSPQMFHCTKCPKTFTSAIEAAGCCWPKTTVSTLPFKIPQAPKTLPSAPPKLGKQELTMAQKYPKYYKDVSDISVLDVYGVHRLFNIQDPSGAIQHASKKLLLSGVRTGGKSVFKDIQEARDTLNRWLELNPE